MVSKASRALPSAGETGALAPLSRRARRGIEVRNRIFRAALELFARQGYVQTTVEQITEAADVGKGTFFYHFPSKEHVLGAFGDIRVNKVRAAAEEARLGRRPIRQVLEKLFDSLAEDYRRAPNLFRCVLLTMLANEPVRQDVAKRFQEGLSALEVIFQVGQQRGEIRGDRKPMEMARSFQQMFFGTLLLWSVGKNEKLDSMLAKAFKTLWSAAESPRSARSSKGNTNE